MKQRCQYCGRPLDEPERTFCGESCEEQFRCLAAADQRLRFRFLGGMFLGFLLLFLGAVLSLIGITNRLLGAGIGLAGLTITLWPLITPESIPLLGYRKAKLFARILGCLLLICGLIIMLSP